MLGTVSSRERISKTLRAPNLHDKRTGNSAKYIAA